MSVLLMCRALFSAGAGPAKPFRTVRGWRAHRQAVTSLSWSDREGLLVSASADGTVMLWTSTGQLVGMFGQVDR